MKNPEETAISNPSVRWFHPTPGRMLVVLLSVEGILLLCHWFRWTPKGWSVLMAIVAVAVTIVLMFLWFAVALVCRWRFQFSSRSLLVLTIAVAIPSSWLAVEMKWAKSQKEAVDAIEKAGGGTLYDYEQQFYETDLNNQIKTPPEPRYPIWLRTMLGDDFFFNVTFVIFHGDSVNDADLESVKGLEQIKGLNLANSGITDDGLEQIMELKHLESLQISGCKGITNEGLKRLGELRQLKWIDVSYTKVTDAGIERLHKALPNLTIER